MKFWARIRLKEGEDTQPILVAFFQEFKPGNAIRVEGNIVSIEVNFDEQYPPKEIPEAIGGYSDIDFGCGELSSNFGENEQPEPVTPASDEQIEEKPIPVEGAPKKEDDTLILPPEDEEVLVQPEEGEPILPAEEDEKPPVRPSEGQDEESPVQPSEGQDEEEAEPKKKKRTPGGRGKTRKAPDQIPVLDKIAQGSTSYKAFIEAVAKRFELTPKRGKYFLDLVEAAATVEKVNWTLIDNEMSKKGYNNPFATRQGTAIPIVKKLNEMEIECSFLALIEYMAKYKNFDFDAIISERVKNILTEMGLSSKVPESQKLILQFANAAVRVDSEQVNFDEVCMNMGIKSQDEIDGMRMILAGFANDFYKGHGKPILTTTEFIAKLKKAVDTGESML